MLQHRHLMAINAWWKAGGGKRFNPQDRQPMLGEASKPGREVTLKASDEARQGIENAVAVYDGPMKVQSHKNPQPKTLSRPSKPTNQADAVSNVAAYPCNYRAIHVA